MILINPFKQKFHISEFVIFLLGEDRGLEKPDNRDNTVRSRLIERCNHVSEEVGSI